jgi:hypothetical protein
MNGSSSLIVMKHRAIRKVGGNFIQKEKEKNKTTRQYIVVHRNHHHFVSPRVILSYRLYSGGGDDVIAKSRGGRVWNNPGPLPSLSMRPNRLSDENELLFFIKMRGVITLFFPFFLFCFIIVMKSLCRFLSFFYFLYSNSFCFFLCFFFIPVFLRV